MSESTPIDRARRLRQNLTPEEKLLWSKLRGRRFYGYKFLRQHPIVYQLVNNKRYYFIADFYCAEKKTVIEIDGKIHDFQKDYDQHRNEILNSLGLRVLRIENEELRNLNQLMEKIRSFL